MRGRRRERQHTVSPTQLAAPCPASAMFAAPGTLSHTLEHAFVVWYCFPAHAAAALTGSVEHGRAPHRYLSANAFCRIDRNSKTPSWTRIFHCTPSSKNRLDQTTGRIMQMAQHATRIKICGGASTVEADCAISAAGSFPIKMLRQGRAISHDGKAPCDQACVARTWTGGSAAWKSTGLWARFYNRYRNLEDALDREKNSFIYDANGNSAGIVASVRDTAKCGPSKKTASNLGLQAGLQVFIDYQQPTVRECVCVVPLVSPRCFVGTLQDLTPSLFSGTGVGSAI